MPQDFSSSSSIVPNNTAKTGEVFTMPSKSFSTEVDVSGKIYSSIESNEAIQGGEYCLKGTRVTIQGILEAEKNGRSIDEIRKGLKKYFGVDRTIEELEQAKDEYRMNMNPFINELCLIEK